MAMVCFLATIAHEPPWVRALTRWGKPTLVINDLDGNELFFWVPESELASLESEMGERKPKRITSR